MLDTERTEGSYMAFLRKKKEEVKEEVKAEPKSEPTVIPGKFYQCGCPQVDVGVVLGNCPEHHTPLVR